MIMPTGFYQIMTERDLDAIVAYLRTLKPVKNKVPDPIYKMPLAQHVFPGAEKPYHGGDLNDKVKHGFYLVDHRPLHGVPHADGAGRQHPWDRIGTGGREFPGPWGVSVSRNITSSKTKGIGDWTDAEIKSAITPASARTAASSSRPMGFHYYAKMTDGRPRRRGRLSAHGAGEGVTAAFI